MFNEKPYMRLEINNNNSSSSEPGYNLDASILLPIDRGPQILIMDPGLGGHERGSR